MISAKTYLLQQIVGHRSNGFDSLGFLHAKHVDDIAKVMETFAIATLDDVIGRLNKGKKINVGNGILSLNRKRKAAQ